MIAQLQDGRFGDARILQGSTARQMHGTLFRPDARLNGMGYGFIEWDRNGHRVIGHMGNSEGTMTSLSLLPDGGVGLFVADNGDTARPLTIEGTTLYNIITL